MSNEIATEMPEPAQAPDPFQTALNCYLSALLAIGASAAELCPQVGVAFRSRLLRLRRRLAFDASPDSLEQTRVVFESELQEFTQRSTQHVQSRRDDICQALHEVRNSTEALASRHDLYIARLRQFAAEMGSGAASSDPTQLKETFELHAAVLNSCLDSLSHEVISPLDNLRENIGRMKERLAGADLEADTDPVTGLMNRREIKRQLSARWNGEAPLAALRYTLNDFAGMRKAYGEMAADDVMIEFSDRLVAQVRPQDIVYRWQDDQLLVLFLCSAAVAAPRAAQIARWLDGRYKIASAGTIEVTATVAVFEPLPGETVDQLIFRLDAPAQIAELPRAGG